MADVVIVGAGVMGSSIAFQLARRDAGRVVVVDRAGVGQGMSGRSSALVRMHYAFRPEVELAVASLRLFDAWPDLVGAPSVLRRTGFVRFVRPGEEAHLRANVAMQQACGAEVEIVADEALTRLLPDWHLESGEVAAYEPHGAYGDGARVAGDFLARARQLGAEYRPGVNAVGLRTEKGRVIGVDTQGGPIEATIVVVAAGPWTPELLTGIGVHVPITGDLHEIAIVHHPNGPPRARLACIDSATQTYHRPDGEQTTLVGTFAGRLWSDPDHFPQQPTVDSLGAMVEAAARRLPALAVGGIARGYTGIYDMTPDARALIGVLPEAPGVCLAAGFSGTGFKLSPAVGVVVAELLLDGRATTVDISAFRPDRFQRNEPIQPLFEYADALG